MAKRHDCDICGEEDLKTHTISVLRDGKSLAKWRMCRACAAAALVRLALYPYSRR